jgi:carboxyl-terminal processing protease
VAVDQFADGDPDDALVTREADYPNHLANIQDPNEKKELEARAQDRQEEVQMLEEKSDKETPEQRQRDRDRAPVEFGSSGDFMLQQALNKLQGKPVQESKALLERRLAQTDTPASAAQPAEH